MTVAIDARGIAEVERVFEAFPLVAAQAMSRALNFAVKGIALELARKEIMAEVAFPEGYLDLSGRLEVTQYSTPTQLRAVITGRDRPTSLARFVVGSPGKGERATWQVNPGQTFSSARVFLVNLRSGNIGLAIRLRPGEVLNNPKGRREVRLADNLYLLYGPSVDQVFGDVAQDITPAVSDAVEVEFTRQMAVLLKVGQ